MSASGIDVLSDLWLATLLKHNDIPPFMNHTDLYSTIDRAEQGGVPWQSFNLSYNGALPDGTVPSWMAAKHEVWFRDPRQVVHNLLGNPDFDGEIDYGPVRVFDEQGRREVRDLHSGDWAWRQADIISQDPDTHGSAFVSLVVGSDKTTVSVATGQNDYYPLYLSIGNVHNNVRRAHRDAVVLIGFLAIPRTDREYANDDNFRDFRRQLFHASLSRIFQPLKKWMTKPDIVRCADGHFRRVIYGLGPYIADYPEQAWLACIVQGWCAKYVFEFLLIRSIYI